MPYSVHDYGRMIGDRLRMDAHVRAIEAAVRPGAVVLDLGAGTGVFSLLACKLGARRVFAIEPNPAIQVARELALANGFSDRIEFFAEPSERVTLPEPADVIISDLRGALPFCGKGIPALADARKRHLKPGGVLIPLRDRLWLSVAEAPEEHQRATEPWGPDHLDLNVGPWKTCLVNSWHTARVKSSQLLSEPALWAELNYLKIESPDVQGKLQCAIRRDGTGHGFFLWFEATLVEGVSFSGGPDAPEMVYGTALFPWPDPVPLAAGDAAEIDLKASLVGEEYIWTWKTSIHPAGQPAQTKARFSQSTFFSGAISPADLRKRGDAFVPRLNEDGQIRRRGFELMSQGLPLWAIAERLLAEFPSRFLRREDSLGYVGDLSQKYSL